MLPGGAKDAAAAGAAAGRGGEGGGSTGRRVGVVSGRAAEQQQGGCSFILRDCLHGTSLDVAFASPRGFRELFAKSLDAALRVHEWLEEERFAMLLRAKKAALLVSARSDAEREGEGAAEALTAAVGMLRACCDGAWRRQWNGLFHSFKCSKATAVLLP